MSGVDYLPPSYMWDQYFEGATTAPESADPSDLSDPTPHNDFETSVKSFEDDHKCHKCCNCKEDASDWCPFNPRNAGIVDKLLL